MPEEKRTPQEWARELGANLHAMSDERWAAYIRYLEEEDRDELARVFERLVEESKGLRAALRADKWGQPEDKKQRVWLSSSLRELRTRRLADVRGLVAALVNEGDDGD